ncbi:hypothetical protein AB0K16_22420 [Nonomuraea jabiensis]|uniref:hypothetical protein n=1 Tax=Nonomuraea jabiensis TaxID=882448 RepID=UPI003438E752
MYFSTGDFIEVDGYPGDPLEVLSTSACDEHENEDHESLLVYFPGFGEDWICQLRVIG